MCILAFLGALRRTFLTPLGLSMRQLRHEWASALCQCFALSAVILPLLLLYGLKNGVIKSEWERLQNDPDTLVLLPNVLTSPSVTMTQIRELSNRRGVQCVLPQPYESEVSLCKPGEKAEQSLSYQMVFTQQGDPTIAYYRDCPFPVFHSGRPIQEAVLSYQAAQELGIETPGALLNLVKGPINLPLRVVGILPQDNKSRDVANKRRVFIDKELGFALLDFHAGLIPRISDGALTAPLPTCRHLLLLAQAKDGEAAPAISAEESERLLALARECEQEAGVSADVQLQQEVKDGSGKPLALPQGGLLLAFKPRGTEGTRLASEVASALAQKAGESICVLPWNPPLSFSNVYRDSDTSTATAPWADSALLQELSRRRAADHCILYTGVEGSDATPTAPDFSRAESDGVWEIRLWATDSDELKESVIDVEIVKVPGLPTHGLQYLCAPEDLARLSFSQTAATAFEWKFREPKETAFFLRERRFMFRCYANSIDDVEVLKEELEALPPVRNKRFRMISAAEDIAKNRTLDANLQRLLLIISALGGAGAMIALLFNLFNATERRKKDYAILRTLGLGRIALITLPVYETAFVMLLTLAVSFGCYHGVNFLVMHQLSGLVPAGGTLCDISLHEQLLFGLGTLALATVAAFLSSLRLCRLSPAAYIRES